jgi:hypothetical protein
MNYKLHYAPIKLDGDIPCYEFKNYRSMIDFIDKKTYGRNRSVVWILAKNDFEDVIVTQNAYFLQEVIGTLPLWQTIGDYFLQEYDSFESAYKVALDMMEPYELCYEKD